MKSNSKILIVDDEKMVLKTLGMLLKLEGFNNVSTFDNPVEALEFLKKNQVDLILSDFIMPNMNGIEFLSKAKEIYPETTQILLTGYADKQNAIKAINEVGIYKYIEKPWDNANLIVNIKNGIERTQLKKQLEEKIIELEALNSSLEKTVQERTKDLAQTNLRLSTIINNCADGIVIFDENNKITLVNKATEDMWGLQREDVLGKNFFEMLINEKNQKFSEALNKLENIYLRDFSIVDYKNKKQIPIEINIAPILDGDKKNFIASLRNVSYQKENEALKDDFIATLTHDLRTPLLASISGLDFILKGTLGEINEKQNNMLDVMKKSNEDMLGLVNALLEVYRFESGKMFLSKEQFCINTLVKECCSILKPLTTEKNIEIQKELQEKGNTFIINADKEEIKRVILNLLGNAIKFSENNSKILIETQAKDKDFYFSVQDEGCGLDKEECKNLFQRFYGGKTKKRACTTGLGLYLSKQIIDAHLGEIQVESEKGKGSKFSFILKKAITESRVLI